MFRDVFRKGASVLLAILLVIGAVPLREANVFAAEAGETYTVTFESNGGSEVAPQTVEAGGKATKKTPTKDYYVFDVWCTDEELTQEYDFSTPVTSSFTLYARWSDAVIEFTKPDGTKNYMLKLSSGAFSNTGTYKLLADYQSTSRMVPGMMATNVTLDLNGHTLTSTATDCAILLTRAGTATAHKTFDLISSEGSGTLIVNPDANMAFQVSGKYNDVTIGENVTIDGNSIFMLGEEQTLVVDGTVKGGSNFAVATNGSSTKNTAVTINGTLTSDGTAVYLPGNEGVSAVVNEGASITGKSGIEIRGGELTVNEGAEITATGEFSEAANANGTTVKGAAIAVSQHTTNLPITVTIAGGTMTGAKALREVDLQDEVTENVTIIISGGRFVGDVSSEHAEKFISEGEFDNPVDSAYVVEGRFCTTTLTNSNGYYYIVSKISSVDVAVTAPVKLAAPETATAASAEYEAGTIAWTPGVSEAFSPATEYTATVTVEPKEGYIFSGETLAKINGLDAAILSVSEGEITFSYTFDETAAKEIAGITIKTEPDKTEYVAGQTFDPAGMVITVAYDDGSTVDVTEGYTCDKTDALTENDTVVMVTYEGQTARQPITVVERAVTGIAIKTAPDKTAYTEGQTFDPAGMVITVTYNDGTTEDITEGYTYDKTDALTANDTAVTVSYEGQTAEQAITVTASGGSGGGGGGGGGGGAAADPGEVIGDDDTPLSNYEPCAGDETCPGRIFTDMPPVSHWAHAPIDWAIVNGITAGTTPTTFSPDAPCTRAQFVTFLWAAAGCPEAEGSENPFDDVKEGAYYYKAVLWAAEKGITAGTSPTTFSPDDYCLRCQVVTFLWAYAGAPALDTADMPFEDVAQDAYYAQSVLWAVENGITAGTSATEFSPEARCVRAQVVTFLYGQFNK